RAIAWGPMPQGPLQSYVAQASASAPGGGAQGPGLQAHAVGLWISVLGPSESNAGPVAEFIDERPEEVKRMEEFRTNSKWKLLGELDTILQLSSETTKQKKIKHSSDPSPRRRGRHDSPEFSPPRKQRHDSSDESLSRNQCRKKNKKTMDKSLPGGIQGERSNLRSGFPHKSSSHHKRQITPDLSPLRKNRDSSDLATSPSRRKRTGSPSGLKKQSSTRDAPQTLACPGFYRAPNCISSVIIICYLHIIAGFSPANKKPKQAPSPKRRKRHDSDSSLARKSSQDSSDSDLSPLRNSHRPGLLHRDSPSKLSPPKRNQNTSSDSDLSPPRRSQAAGKKLHGSRTGLVSADLLRREQQELRRHDRNNKHLEDESQNAETVFRDKSGRKRDLMQERLEQQKKAEAKSERDELYAKWGKGLAQSRQQQQNVEDAVKEMQKPLARYIDDQDLDQMLREKEREGDPMANFIRKKKAKESKDKKEKPRYNGPAPPLNRFNLWPGYRWDGVDRSNGFEQKRFARLASKKAVQELAYKWSVEDM
uniref:BUD13 homolog n=1 Tax=Terrapene triunguis TaxID=2587831 RepID=A0A674IK20_9SAUR